jgi:hypothetical protein
VTSFNTSSQNKKRISALSGIAWELFCSAESSVSEESIAVALDVFEEDGLKAAEDWLYVNKGWRFTGEWVHTRTYSLKSVRPDDPFTYVINELIPLNWDAWVNKGNWHDDSISIRIRTERGSYVEQEISSKVFDTSVSMAHMVIGIVQEMIDRLLDYELRNQED